MLGKNIYTIVLVVLVIGNLFAQVNVTQWQRTNGPLGGDTTEILETDDGDLILGTRVAGLYRSNDKGQTWALIPESSGAPVLFRGIYDLVKNSQGHIFAGTNSGIYRSLDGGDTWQAFGTGAGTNFVEALAINSIDVLFAATRGGIVRSEDNGETWVLFNNGLTNTYATAVAINSLGDVFCGTRSGVFFSDDNGDNWSERSSGLIGNKQMTTIFVTPEDTLLAGSFDGVFRSDDHGMNWTRVLQSGTPLSFARSASNVLIYGSAGSFIHRSIDNGLTWTAGSGFINLAGFKDFHFLGSTDLLAATYRYGVLHSTDNGDSWTELNTGIYAQDIQSLALTTSGDILAGSAYGPFSSSDGGETWTLIATPFFNGNTGFMQSNSTGRVFAEIGARLAISDDNGDTWFEADSSFDVFNPESVAFGNENDVYVGVDGQVYKSINNGDTWTAFSSGLPSERIQALAVNSMGTVFAGCDRSGAFRSTDAGTTWVDISTGLPENFDVTEFVLDPNGDVLLSGFGGVYRSSDNGDTWVSTGNPPFSDIRAFIRSAEGNLYVAGRGSGVAVSQDGGATWTRINDGVEHMDAQALLIDNSGSLYLGTRGGGIFQTRFISTSVKQVYAELPETFSLEQNYPNPFNPSTTIKYQIPTDGYVKLAIYNPLGQRVRNLLSRHQPMGTYHVKWDGKNEAGFPAPTGIYYYRLEVIDMLGTKNELVKKLTLLK